MRTQLECAAVFVVELDMGARYVALVSMKDELQMADGTDSGHFHHHAYDIGGVQLRLPFKGGKVFAVYEAQQRGACAKNLRRLTAHGQQVFYSVELDGRADIIVQKVIYLLKYGAYLYVGLDLHFHVYAYLHGRKDMDVLDHLSYVPVLEEKVPDMFLVPLFITVAPFFRLGLAVQPAYDAHYEGIIQQALLAFQFNENVVVASGLYCLDGLPALLLYYDCPFRGFEPYVPYAGNILQDQFSVILYCSRLL